MSSTKAASNTNARTQTLQANGHSYAYRRFGNGSGLPLLFLQHFTGTLDNWEFRTLSPKWPGTPWRFLTDSASSGAMSSGTRSVEWSRFKWCRTAHRSFDA